MAARPLFVGGTSSNAGKSWTATAICAWLRRKGYAVAPFKAQTMSNNSHPCRNGGEIGRAQAAQAEACGLEPEPAMNPILLKPNGDGTSQVIVNGRVWRTVSGRGYYDHFDFLLTQVRAAYDDLASRFDAVVIEGAGSVSELNLREWDLVNLGFATRIGAPWILVSDIERGGVFASIIGTAVMLSPAERALFQGFIVNKFRGDRSLFEAGVAMLETHASAHCFGVFPFEDAVQLDAEDSLATVRRPSRPAPASARIAIVRLPCLSNSTDFKLLTWADWIDAPSERDYDFIILPGSKHTIADLAWLRETGLAEWVVARHRAGAVIIGICGGYQMLGRVVRDPNGAESALSHAEGLGVLPVETVLGTEKTSRVVTAVTASGTRVSCYEIHLGVTTRDAAVTPFARLNDGTHDGAIGCRAIGTYLHGALESAAVCAELFKVPLEYLRTAPNADAYERLAEWFDTYGRGLDRLGF